MTRELYRDGEATYFSNSLGERSVRLLKLDFVLRGESCRPGLRLVMALLAGNRVAKEIVEAWRVTFPPPLPIVIVEAERIAGPYSTWQPAPMAAD